jgi:hypothetical protein
MLAVGQPQTIVSKQRKFKILKVAELVQSWGSVLRVRTWFEAFTGIFLVCYLLAAIALSGALLFYTFHESSAFAKPAATARQFDKNY